MAVRSNRSIPFTMNTENIPSLVYCIHKDDCAIGSTVWNPRVGTMAIGSNVAYSKDSNGVYVASIATLSASGAMPVIKTGKYHLNISVGTPSSSIHASTFNLGDSSISDSYNSNGSVYLSQVQQISTTGLGSLDFGQQQCNISYTDWAHTTVATSSAFRVVAIASPASPTQIQNNTVIVAPGAAARDSSLPSVVSIGGFDAVIDTQRQILAAIISTSSPLQPSFITNAAIWMASHLGQLYPGFSDLPP